MTGLEDRWSRWTRYEELRLVSEADSSEQGRVPPVAIVGRPLASEPLVDHLESRGVSWCRVSFGRVPDECPVALLAPGESVESVRLGPTTMLLLCAPPEGGLDWVNQLRDRFGSASSRVIALADGTVGSHAGLALAAAWWLALDRDGLAGLRHSGANEELALRNGITHARACELAAVGIAPVWNHPRLGPRIWSTTTIGGDDWVSGRVLAHLERELADAASWAVFEPKSPALARRVERACEVVLRAFRRAGLFAREPAPCRCELTPDGLRVEVTVQPVGAVRAVELSHWVHTPLGAA